MDVQPSNIFYDEGTECFTLVDVGGMGLNAADTDLEHFVKSLQILAKSYVKKEKQKSSFLWFFSVTISC